MPLKYQFTLCVFGLLDGQNKTSAYLDNLCCRLNVLLITEMQVYF